MPFAFCLLPFAFCLLPFALISTAHPTSVPCSLLPAPYPKPNPNVPID
ncbi:hypothetical protein [Moorena sp. SIO4G3]|nr:hypothetical protein [Moorena sp. SIO4G3]NEO77264.1 hypothetical protein [Moorena sp. SIO4G3]